MNEERAYGLEDGRADATAGRKPEVKLNISEGNEYELGYVGGYNRALAEQAENSGKGLPSDTPSPNGAAAS